MVIPITPVKSLLSFLVSCLFLIKIKVKQLKELRRWSEVVVKVISTEQCSGGGAAAVVFMCMLIVSPGAKPGLVCVSEDPPQTLAS